MTLPILLIIATWIVFIVYWGISSIGVKKDVTGRWAWIWSGPGFAIRVFVSLVIVVTLLSRVASVRHAISYENIAALGSPVMDFGALLCVAGVAFAIWARRHLGRNWSSHPALKEDPELVTSGPYRWVRHPIYTGLLFAIFGSALAAGPLWFLYFLLAAAIFVRRVFVEEAMMERQFPGQYKEYKNRTKALIPFVW